MSVELRKQMEFEDVQVLERAADIELDHLKRLRLECASMTGDPKVFEAISRREEAVNLAKSRLRRLFIDQFPAGREENDKAGHTGLPDQSAGASAARQS